MLQRTKALQYGIGILAAFALCYFTIPYDKLKLYLDSGRAGVWAMVYFVTLSVALPSFFAKRRSQGMVVSIALNIGALVILTQAIWIPLKRVYGANFPAGVPNLVDLLVVLGFIVSGAFFLMPIGNTIGITPPRNWWLLFLAGCGGALFGGIMIGMGLNTLPG